MSNHDETMVSLPKGEQVSRPPDSKPAKVKPDHIYVEERLHYRADIADRTDIFFEKAAGQIDIVFPAPSQSRQSSQTAAPAKPAKQKPGGYLALSRYDATVWQPPLRDDGIPVKIPITGPGPAIETESKITLNYELNPNHKDIPSNPVMVAAKIIDRSSRIDAQSGLDFVEGLRLELTISSEIDAFYGVDAEDVTEQVRSQIEADKENEATLRKRLGALSGSNGSKLGEKFRTRSQSLSGKSDDADTTDNVEELEEKLKKAGESKKAFEGVLQSREDERRIDRDFFSNLMEVWRKHRSLGPTELERWLRKVKLGHLELKIPYTHGGSTTLVKRPDPDESDKTIFQSLFGYESRQTTTTTTTTTPAIWRFNPERWTLELREQSLGWNTDTKLYEAEIHLNLDPPSAGNEQISGSLTLYIDEPISKIQVGWSDDKRANVDHDLTRYRTWLQLDFEIDFFEIFKKRSFLLERRLHFEGVVFHVDHITNIRHILNNWGLLIIEYRDKAEPAGSASNGATQVDEIEITAIRQGLEWDIVSLKITSKMAEGSHTITYNQGEEKLTRSIPFGAIDVVMLARMTGKSEKINELLDNLQNDLEKYFTSSIFIRSQEESK